jgi:hypothetical protein
MNSRHLGVVFVVCSVFLHVACSKTGRTPPKWLQGVNLTNLTEESQSLAESAQHRGDWSWDGKDTNLPRTIRSLAPMRVTVYRHPAPTIVEIKIQGGFRSHGLIIVCDPAAAYTNSSYGNGWPLKRITPRVFEYEGTN